MLSAAAIAGYSILSVFGGYVATSVLLLNFPGILHKKKKPHFSCCHISHRGGSAEKIENTLTAYHNAIDAGTQMIELDVCLTKDKKVVVSHDPDLCRSTGQDGLISDYNYEDLPLLKKDLSVGFMGSTVCQHDKHERMPTLEEVFQEFSDIPINLDIKVENDELMEKANELIKQYRREKITVWGNFKNTTTQKLYKLNPDVPLLFSIRRVMLVYFAFYLGFLPFLSLRETHFEVPLLDAFKHVNVQLSAPMKALLHFANFVMKSRILFNHLKKRGIPTYLWVINYEEDFETAFKLGAEGVMTDCPTKLTKWLQDHPQYII